MWHRQRMQTKGKELAVVFFSCQSSDVVPLSTPITCKLLYVSSVCFTGISISFISAGCKVKLQRARRESEGYYMLCTQPLCLQFLHPYIVPYLRDRLNNTLMISLSHHTHTLSVHQCQCVNRVDVWSAVVAVRSYPSQHDADRKKAGCWFEP